MDNLTVAIISRFLITTDLKMFIVVLFVSYFDDYPYGNVSS